MHKILHGFKRNRSYSSHERWGVFAGMLLLTLAISAGGWMLMSKPAASATSIAVTEVKLSKDILAVGEKPNGNVVLTLAHKETSIPAEGIWIGLRIPLSELRTPQFTYYDWYSPESGRAFYQTDKQGKVEFPLASLVPGLVEYQVYAGNPEISNDTKYQNLHKSFIVDFK